MLLKYNKVLRFLTIFLLSVELLLPIGALANDGNIDAESNHISFSINHQSVDITHLICEEANSEEREGKNDCYIGVCFVEVFSELLKFEPTKVTWSLPKERFDTQPSLYTLHRVLQI